MKIYHAIVYLLFAILANSCENAFDYPIPPNSFEVVETDPPAVVTLEQQDGVWKMFVDGEEFYVKGVAANNFHDKGIQYGANTVRTYGVNDSTRATLDKAYAAGMYVNFGLYIRRETDGFDYNNQTAVDQQFQAMREAVLQFKDHPAILCWSIGNEAEASYTNTKLWTAINDIATMIHEEDPNHPTTTTLASSNVSHIQHIIQMAPEIDILSVNTYAPNLPGVLNNLATAGWQKPYMITEYGPRGTWQMNPEPDRILNWGALVEQTSTEKAQIYLDAYQNHIVANRQQGCIGSFVFLWGYQLHGEVLTWYGMFDKQGNTFAAVDAMQYAWTGSYPTNRAPVIQDRSKILMNGKRAEENITVSKNSTNIATVEASDPDNDPLTYAWRIIKEKSAAADGSLPNGIAGLITDATLPSISFNAPNETGGYRLIIFVIDQNNKKAASAVIPFYVE
ncbi:glycosyl hydrolase family 2 [Sphingobacterium olei]|uniref:Glycosyl hydrolase family 2 n=1 Tax=Sphingobacterium olei TaxID=2571155 RepID=A0A4U0NKA0_9SPHI|nr:glycoside hydrolase family 2 TIM barrel-domain containing protein [Sphingobacterium olei]TJZ54775.1 glycosyl hydrolase family 2 [Sphingobacterium olei]